MPTAESQFAAVTEAQHIAAESARRGTDNARAALEVTRALVETASDVNRRLFEAWLSGAEASLNATFQVQRAGLTAGRAVFDATATSQRATLTAFEAVASEIHNATLQAFQSQVNVAGPVADRAKR